MAATRSGDLNALTQPLASDVRVVTDGAGKVAASLIVPPAPLARRSSWLASRAEEWREDFTLRFATIDGLPGVIADGPEGPVQTAAFEIEGDVIRTLCVVCNPNKVRYLTAALRHESGRG